MRFLKLDSRGEPSLTDDPIKDIPCYAILSHTWGADADEATFKDLENGSGKSKAGYNKIRFCGEQAKKDGLQYFWVDTCCIDKSSSAELQEAINSMFRWYRDAAKCYVYLSDVSTDKDDKNDQTQRSWESAFRNSRWFTRGWTLQELIAPKSVEFFSEEKKLLGDKRILEQQIHEITGIPIRALHGTPLSEFRVDERLRWAENRKTQKEEDKAYCLLGIFDVFMPFIYGEGENSFARLKVEIEGSLRKLPNLSETTLNLANLDKATKKSLNDLQATNPELDMERIEQSKDPLLKDCYEWILNNPTLQEWRDGNTCPLLWIKGDPGKGKTMLMIALARELKNPPRNPHTVAFFFCQNTDARLNTAASILRGLIWRLAMQDARLADIFHTMYQSRSCQLNGPNAIYALFSTLLAMLGGFPGAFILIDALDECSSGTEREQLLDLIVKHATSSKTKWLLSSRNDADIKQVLMHDSHMLSLELNEVHISRAVRAFIEQKTNELAKKNTYSSELKEKVKKDLIAKSDSTFLWVALACKRLLKDPSQKALSTLQDLPPGLQGLYSRMMDQVFQTEDEEDRHICVGILRLVTLTFRPLSVGELVTTAGLPPELLASSLLNLIELCGSFITVRTGIIYFVHQSAKDYLVADGARKIFSTGIQEEHGLLVGRSLDAMSKTLRKDMCNLRHPGAPARSASINTRLKAISYICSFWVAHLVQYLGDNLIDGLNYLEHFSNQGRVHKFLLERLLHWFEALSLIGEVDRGIHGLYSFDRMIQKKLAKSSVPDTTLSIKNFVQMITRKRTKPSSAETTLHHNTFVRDAIRVFRQCRTAVEEAPLQVYFSALIFAPEGSVVRKTFEQETFQWISSLPRISYNWKPCLQTLEGYGDSVDSIAFSPDGRQLASGSEGSTIVLWDASTGKCLQTLVGHTGWVSSVEFSPDGRQLASGSNDSTIRLWNASTGKCLQTLEGHTGSVNSIAFSPDGQQLASGSEDSTIRLWDASTGKCLQTLECHTGPVWSVAFSPDGRQLASGSEDSTIRLWDASTGKCLQTLECHTGSIWSVAFSPDGRQLASGSRDSTIRLWDASTGKCLQTLEGHTGWVLSVEFSPDGRQLASGSEDSTIRLWDASTGKCLQTLEGHRDLVNSVAFFPDGRQLASASDDSTIRLWDASYEKCLQTLECHTGSVWSVAFSPDGRQLASGSEDSTIRLWDASTGKCLQTFEALGDWVDLVAFSPNGRQLASRSSDSVIRIWDASTGKCLQIFEGHDENASFTPDGLNLVTDSGTLSVRQTLQSGHAQWTGCGVDSESSWITWDGNNILWLPPEYRPAVSAVKGNCIGIGCKSGAVYILNFRADVLCNDQ